MAVDFILISLLLTLNICFPQFNECVTFQANCLIGNFVPHIFCDLILSQVTFFLKRLLKFSSSQENEDFFFQVWLL